MRTDSARLEPVSRVPSPSLEDLRMTLRRTPTGTRRARGAGSGSVGGMGTPPTHTRTGLQAYSTSGHTSTRKKLHGPLSVCGGGPDYSASPVYGWCKSDCVGITQAIPYPPAAPVLPCFRVWVLGVPWQFSVSPVLCRHRRSLLRSCPSWAPVYGWSETVWT